jgi:hypothetical protein
MPTIMHAHNLDRLSQTSTAEHINGPATVMSRSGPHLQLECGGQRLEALRASSCLLEPAPGDHVWCVGAGDECYVIAVLARTANGNETTTVCVEGDLRLVAGGRVCMSAIDGIQLATEASLQITADELQIEATRGRLVFEDLRAIARTVFASFVRATHLGGSLELFVERIIQRSQHVQRSVEGVDSTEAGTLIQRARGTAHLQAKRALINGTQLTKIDGEQVQLG